MFDNKDSRDAADRLGEIWDDVTRAGGDVASPEDCDAALAGRLQQMVPPLNETTRERMRARVLASQRGEAPRMTATTIRPGGLIAPLPQPALPTRRWSDADSPIMRIAAMILLALSIGGAWLGLRSLDNNGEPRPTPMQGAIVATPESGQDEVGYRESVLIQEVPATGISRQFIVDVTRVTLAPGSSYSVQPGSLSLGQNPIGFFVQAGSLQVVDASGTTDIGSSGSWQGMPTGVQNASTGNVTFIQVTLLADGETSPVLPENATTVAYGQIPVTQPLGSVTTINFSSMASNMPDMEMIGSGSSETTAFVAVNSGELTLTPVGGAEIAQGTFGNLANFAPADGNAIIMKAGDTLIANANSSLTSRGTETGDELMTGFVLTVLNMSPEDIAAELMLNPAVVDWDVPAGTEKVSFTVQSLTLQPNTELSVPLNGAVILQAISGGTEATFGDDSTQRITVGGYTTGVATGNLVIRNSSELESTLLLVTVVPGITDVSSLMGSLPEGVSGNVLAFGQTPISGGQHTISLGTQAIDNTSGMGVPGVEGAEILILTDGDLVFTPTEGDVLVPGAADAAALVATPVPTGTSMTLSTGAFAIVANGGGYEITGASDRETAFISLSIRPVVSDATPTPAANMNLAETPTPAPISVEKPSPTPTPAPETSSGGIPKPTPTPSS